jgi:hypothetical protein
MNTQDKDQSGAAVRGEAVALTNEEIDMVWQSMPGGPSHWLKGFGYQNFARAIECECRLKSARAADAPSEPSEREMPEGWLAKPYINDTDILRMWEASVARGHLTQTTRLDFARLLEAAIVKNVRAADALDSQPTVLAYVATDLDGRADVGMTLEKAMERAGHGCDTIIPVYDLGSSQPTERVKELEAQLAECVAVSQKWASAAGEADGRAEKMRESLAEVLKVTVAATTIPWLHLNEDGKRIVEDAKALASSQPTDGGVRND